ncbi:MAG: urease accessory protein UreJ [Cereibacter sphaeroides]|uniref:Urease accessory protein UreJ n=1 Tax=Cereibacter sphaeroides TaxID=1063 RepID=A0A2W5SGE6_CERSP|nr:MAG: urease accessory protein UreJ [Cereibacter sphaeroides]
MKAIPLSLLLIVLAVPALAHTGQGDANGFVHGLLHPLTGPDHLLAMLAVGLWSGFVLPDRFWLGAATFMSAMAAGAVLSWAGVPLPGVEILIAGSVIVFGLLIVASRRSQLPMVTQASLAMIGLFAACHGQAHATEATGTIVLYLGGFLISTAALHIAGIALARSAAQSAAARIMQGGLGGLIAASGLYMNIG